MLESLNYSFRNPKKHILSNLPHQTVEKLQKNHGALRGPQLGKQRWRARLGKLRVKCTHNRLSVRFFLWRILRTFCFPLDQCFSTSVRPRPDKFFFIRRGPSPNKFIRKYSSNFFLSSHIKLTQVLINNYVIIIKSISTLIYMVWHVDKYKITFKFFHQLD